MPFLTFFFSSVFRGVTGSFPSLLVSGHSPFPAVWRSLETDTLTLVLGYIIPSKGFASRYMIPYRDTYFLLSSAVNCTLAKDLVHIPDFSFNLTNQPGLYTSMPLSDSPLLHPSIQTWEALKGKKVEVIIDFFIKNKRAGRKGTPRRFLPCETYVKAPAWWNMEQEQGSSLSQRITLRAAIPETSHCPI